MANKIFPKGSLVFPYNAALLNKVVGMSGGKLSDGRFSCTIHSKDKPGIWTMPSVFFCRYEEEGDHVNIDYQVFPGLAVWLLLFLPVLALIAVIAFRLEEVYTTATAFLTGVAVVCYAIQRKSSIERFQQRFGK